MDGVDAMASNTWPPIWSLVRGYFTPATLFLLVNLVIGTIALTTRSHSSRRSDDHHQKGHQQQQKQAPPVPAPLARTSTVVERLRSLGLYRFRSGDFPPEYDHAAVQIPLDDDGSKQQPSHYTRSQSEPAARPEAQEEKAAAARMKKSSSEAGKPVRVPAPALQRAARDPARKAVVEEEAVGVDARADDFINKFRQQLQLQRLNSLLNYREMLKQCSN